MGWLQKPLSHSNGSHSLRIPLGVAETGSGKTAAFVLPMLDYIARLPRITKVNDGPYAPTREVVQQIKHETVKLARWLGIKVVCVFGGQSIEKHVFKLRQGCEVVIATPASLVDCLERHYVVLNQCNHVVLDDADQMLDMGYEHQIVEVLNAMPYRPNDKELRMRN